MTLLSVSLLILCSNTITGFIPPHSTRHIISTPPTSSRLFLAKGFDTKNSNPNKKSPPNTSSTSPTPSTPISPSTNEEPNAGQKALANLRSEQARKETEELSKIREVRRVDEFVRDDPTAAVIPEKVAMRMGKRMLPFVGIPLFGGMGTFVAFWYFATYKNVEFQPALVAFTTIALLATGLVGITYSVMSSSWDPDEEGSALGFEEFKTNVENLKDGLKRSRENLVVREQMKGMSEEEIEKAIRKLDKRDEREKMKKMSLEEKMKKELSEDEWL